MMPLSFPPSALRSSSLFSCSFFLLLASCLDINNNCNRECRGSDDVCDLEYYCFRLHTVHITPQPPTVFNEYYLEEVHSAQEEKSKFKGTFAVLVLWSWGHRKLQASSVKHEPLYCKLYCQLSSRKSQVIIIYYSLSRLLTHYYYFKAFFKFCLVLRTTYFELCRNQEPNLLSK